MGNKVKERGGEEEKEERMERMERKREGGEEERGKREGGEEERGGEEEKEGEGEKERERESAVHYNLPLMHRLHSSLPSSFFWFICNVFLSFFLSFFLYLFCSIFPFFSINSLAFFYVCFRYVLFSDRKSTRLNSSHT